MAKPGVQLSRMKWTMYHGDALAKMQSLPAESISAVVTDPPYGLKFMGKAWDHGVPGVEYWVEALRVAKPGAHLLAFGGTRTFHRLAVAIEDAGWEIRDTIMWVYGGGFPKSLDVSKAIDKAAGAERKVIGERTKSGMAGPNTFAQDPWTLANTGEIKIEVTTGATDAAREWEGYGTALKPAYEPIIIAQKPYPPQHVLATLAPTIGELLCKVDSLEKTGTCSPELRRQLGDLSTASSLSECLVGISRTASRFTTETATALITDLRILKSSLLRLMQAITTEDLSETSGAASSAWDAASISRSVQAKCERLGVTTAGEIAIDWSADEADDQEESRLSPNWRPIIVARKPLAGTVAANVREHGTGALNIDGCRVDGGGTLRTTHLRMTSKGAPGGAYANALRPIIEGESLITGHATGRFPANLIHDGSDEVLAAFPEAPGQQGDLTGNEPSLPGRNTYGVFSPRVAAEARRDVGSAARFFYCAKAAPSERWDYWFCDCQTDMVNAWENADRKPNEPTGIISPPRGTFEETSVAGGDSRTLKYGSEPTDECRLDSRSTTATKTSRTIDSTTSNYSVLPITKENTPVANSGMGNGGNLATPAEHSSQSTPPTGISPGRGGRFMGVAAPAISSVSFEKRNCGACGQKLKRTSHSTVKPLALMQYLCRLVKGPRGGVLLDPFAGSGSTLVAGLREGFEVIGIDQEKAFVEIARRRCAEDSMFNQEVQP